MEIRLKKGAMTDVLWLMFILIIFIIFFNMEMSVSSVPTIDSYAKNIVNKCTNTLATNITGYSTNPNFVNMYKPDGTKREFGNSTDLPATSLYDADASANAIVNYSVKNMKNSIINEFLNNPTLRDTTKSFSGEGTIQEDDIIVDFIENENSTLINVTLNYCVSMKNYDNKVGGFAKANTTKVPRKVVVTRNIENPLRFK